MPLQPGRSLFQKYPLQPQNLSPAIADAGHCVGLEPRLRAQLGFSARRFHTRDVCASAEPFLAAWDTVRRAVIRHKVEHAIAGNSSLCTAPRSDLRMCTGCIYLCVGSTQGMHALHLSRLGACESTHALRQPVIMSPPPHSTGHDAEEKAKSPKLKEANYKSRRWQTPVEADSCRHLVSFKCFKRAWHHHAE